MPDLVPDLAERLGVHRSIEPRGVLPQAAWRLDNRPDVAPGETRVDVELIALDAVLLRRLRQDHGDDPARMRAALLETVAERGKLHDPVTGTGGTLVGTAGRQRVALPSALTAVPLWLTDISRWRGDGPLVPASGYAIAFSRTPVAVVPDDLDLAVTLATLDVAVVPALVRREVGPGARVAVLDGASVAGALASVAAREGGARAVVATVATLEEARLVSAVGAARPLVTDVRDPVATARAIVDALDGHAALTVSCVDVAGAEGAALLATDDAGTALFASRATSFADLVLEAGRLGSRARLLAGGGLAGEGVEAALDLVRTWPSLAALAGWRAGSAPHPLDAGDRV